MLSTYLTIGKAVKDQVKAIHWIDLDKGQLEDPEIFNSIVVPGVLVGNADIEWSQLAGGYQQGQGMVTIKTIIRLPAQTHLTDPLAFKNLKDLALADDVRAAVLSIPGVLSRASTKEYSVLTYYVVEETFLTLFKSGPTYTQKTVSVQFNPFLTTTPNA